MLARRDTREKLAASPMDGLAGPRDGAARRRSSSALFERALAFRDEHTTPHRRRATSSSRPWRAARASSSSPWCGSAACEAEIKADTQATIRNMPLDAEPTGAPCIKCGKPAIADAWFAKSY